MQSTNLRARYAARSNSTHSISRPSRFPRRIRRKPRRYFTWTAFLILLAAMPIVTLLTMASVHWLRARRVEPVPVAAAPAPQPREVKLAESSGAAAAVEKAAPSWNRPAPARHFSGGPFTRRLLPPGIVDLSTQLERTPEIMLEPKPGSAASGLLAHAKAFHSTWAEPGPAPYLLLWLSEFDGLPFRWGADCHTHPLVAKDLETLSKQLHTFLADANLPPAERNDKRPDTGYMLHGFDYVNAMLAQDPVWRTPDAVPALVQILQAEDVPFRRLLVSMLAGIRGELATEALARRAVFDLSPTVREEAVQALRYRPFADYRDIVLGALRYPWPAAAEFAAEALVNFDQTSVVLDLVNMLDEPAPGSAFRTRLGDREVVAVREMVRLNHVQNCLVCHAASADKTDQVRALVPDPDRPPPRNSRATVYYSGDSGLFARADVVYLRQDFSAVQFGQGSSDRPPNQRYDYLVRTRTIRDAQPPDAAPPSAKNPQRESVLFALRELTGEDRGTSTPAWKELLRKGGQAR